jgi:hypothetical protein
MTKKAAAPKKTKAPKKAAAPKKTDAPQHTRKVKAPAELRIEDPSSFQPLVLKPKVDSSNRKEALSKMTESVRKHGRAA